MKTFLVLISPILIPQSGQAKFSLKSISSPSTILAIADPSASFKALSKDSESLPTNSFFY